MLMSGGSTFTNATSGRTYTSGATQEVGPADVRLALINGWSQVQNQGPVTPILPSVTVYPSGDTTGALDTAAINAVLASGAHLSLINGTYYSTGGHTQDVSKQAVYGNGAIIDFSAMATNGTAWTLIATGSGTTLNVQHARNPMQNLVCVGTNTGTTVGLYLNDSAEPSASFLNFNNVVFEQFNNALLVGNNTYICKFFGCYFSRSAVGLNSQFGVTNSSEMLYFSGGGFTDCSSIAIDHENPNTIVILDGCSIDGNNITYIKLDHNARLKLKGSHVECLALSSQSTPMVVVNSGQLSFDDSDLMADGSGSATATSMITVGSGARVSFAGQCLLNNLLNAGGVLASGAGSINFLGPITTFDSTKLPPIIGTESNWNLLQDGGFENASVSDNIGIVGDVTFTASASTASPTVINATNHRQILGQPGFFTTSGTMPTGLPANTTLYVSTVIDTANFNVQYPGGMAVNVTGGGTGTLTWHASPYSRLTGSHITLANSTASHNSGSQSLAATLNGGLGASYIIAVPCQPGHYYGIQGYYNGASTAATSFSLTPAFASDMEYSTGGAPLPVGQALQSGVAVNVGSVPNTWTKFNCALVQAPAWAKWFYLLVNLNNLFNNTLYLDDLVITGY